MDTRKSIFSGLKSFKELEVGDLVSCLDRSFKVISVDILGVVVRSQEGSLLIKVLNSREYENPS